jgi:hypothetical protein
VWDTTINLLLSGVLNGSPSTNRISTLTRFIRRARRSSSAGLT